MSEEKEHTDLNTVLEIEVFDINDEQTTVGNLLNKLTFDEREKLCNSLMKE